MSTETDKKSDPRTVKLRRMRLSFSDSIKDKKPTVADGVPKHTSNFINEADSQFFEQNKELIKAAMEFAGEEAFKNKDAYISIMEDNPKRVCYRRGERFKNKEGEVYKGYAGNWAISAAGPGGNKNPRRPKLFDRHKRPVEEKDILDVFYGGSYCDVILAFYGTETGGRGIFASIEAIRSHQEGERMGGGVYVDADDFDDMDDADDAFDGNTPAADPFG